MDIVVKRTIFRNMKQCCSLDIHPHFEELYYYYLQGGRYAKESTNKKYKES
jgi:hypothetical protein